MHAASIEFDHALFVREAAIADAVVLRIRLDDRDPFDGGMHIPDIFVVQPIFWQGERVAFAVSTAHHADLGGRLPGSSACDNTEIYQDGFRIPLLKLYQRGEPNEAIFALLSANVRVPRTTLGDVRAQLAACHMGEAAVHEIIQRYGADVFLAAEQFHR